MTINKQTGIGNRICIGRVGGASYDFSGDIGAITGVENVPPTIDVSGLNTDVDEYLLGRSKGKIAYSAFFNPDPVNGHHTVMANFRATAESGTIAVFEHRDSIGAPAAFGMFRQLGYKFQRAQNGAVTVPITLDNDAAGPDWGVVAWTGLDAAAATHTGVDLGASGAAHSITDISVADPTVVTSAAHGLASGDTISISGSNSTPSANGDWTVTVLTVDTFSIPLNVTVQGTAGSFSATSLRYGISAVAMLLSLGSGSMTPLIEDSADNVTFAAVSGATMAVMNATTASCQYLRTGLLLVRRYVRMSSTGTFTNASWRGVIMRRASYFD